MKQNTKALLSIVVLVVAATFFSCVSCGGKKVSVDPGGGGPVVTQPEQKDALRQVAEGADRMLNIITAAIKTKRLLAQEGKINRETETAITQGLFTVNEAIIQLGKRAKEYKEFNPAASDDLLRLLDDLGKSLKELNDAGALHIKNEATRQQITAYLTTLGQITTALRAVLQGGR